jgi:hypothetical protein
MSTTVEIFSANCPCCEEAIRLVRGVAGPNDEIRVLSMHEASGHRRAKEVGVVRVPAVAVDGHLASCCTERGVDPEVLRGLGVGASR